MGRAEDGCVVLKRRVLAHPNELPTAVLRLMRASHLYFSGFFPIKFAYFQHITL
jgi:hypothetical protein